MCSTLPPPNEDLAIMNLPIYLLFLTNYSTISSTVLRRQGHDGGCNNKISETLAFSVFFESNKQLLQQQLFLRGQCFPGWTKIEYNIIPP